MKLRLSGDEIRLRLTEPDVSEFAEKGRVRESVSVSSSSGDTLAFELRRDTNAVSLTVTFENSCLTVCVPPAEADRWVGSEAIAMSGFVGSEPCAGPAILVEKDLGCRHPKDRPAANR